jgi:hypothetical protein
VEITSPAVECAFSSDGEFSPCDYAECSFYSDTYDMGVCLDLMQQYCAGTVEEDGVVIPSNDPACIMGSAGPNVSELLSHHDVLRSCDIGATVHYSPCFSGDTVDGSVRRMLINSNGFGLRTRPGTNNVSDRRPSKRRTYAQDGETAEIVPTYKMDCAVNFDLFECLSSISHYCSKQEVDCDMRVWNAIEVLSDTILADESVTYFPESSKWVINTVLCWDGSIADDFTDCPSRVQIIGTVHCADGTFTPFGTLCNNVDLSASLPGHISVVNKEAGQSNLGDDSTSTDIDKSEIESAYPDVSVQDSGNADDKCSSLNEVTLDGASDSCPVGYILCPTLTCVKAGRCCGFGQCDAGLALCQDGTCNEMSKCDSTDANIGAQSVNLPSSSQDSSSYDVSFESDDGTTFISGTVTTTDDTSSHGSQTQTQNTATTGSRRLKLSYEHPRSRRGTAEWAGLHDLNAQPHAPKRRARGKLGMQQHFHQKSVLGSVSRAAGHLC